MRSAAWFFAAATAAAMAVSGIASAPGSALAPIPDSGSVLRSQRTATAASGSILDLAAASTDLAADGSAARVAATADGASALAVWPAHDGTRIEARAMVGSRWSATITPSGETTAVRSADVALSADGSRGVAVWEQGAGGTAVIRSARWDGTSFSAPITLSAADAHNPRIAARGDAGAPVVVWDRYSAGSWRVEARRGGSSGWGTPSILSGALPLPGHPVVAAAHSGSPVVVAWEAAQPPASPPTGTATAPATAPADPSVPIAAARPLVADPDGPAASAVQVAVFDSGWSSPVQVGAVDAIDPVVAVAGGGGGALVAWTAVGPPATVMAARFTAGSWGAPESISGAGDDGVSGYAAEMAHDAASAVAVYTGWRAGVPRVYARTWSGGGWGSASTLSNTDRAATDPSLALGTGGRDGFAAWRQDTAVGPVIRVAQLRNSHWRALADLAGGADDIASLSGSDRGRRAVVVASPEGPAAAGPVRGAPLLTPPDPPGPVSALAGGGAVTLRWGAPTDTGVPVSGYAASLTPGGASCLTAATGCTIRGLRPGRRYSASVVAHNDAGSSEPVRSPGVRLLRGTREHQRVKAPPQRLRVGRRTRLAARTSGGLAVVWRSRTPRVCKVVRATTLWGTRKGRCGVAASAPATPRYAAMAVRFRVGVWRPRTESAPKKTGKKARGAVPRKPRR